MDKKTLFLKAAFIGVVLNTVLSFALSPFDYQPSGTCNFNRLNNVDVKLKLANNTPATIKNKPIHFFAVNYNIYQINGGISGLKYT